MTAGTVSATETLVRSKLPPNSVNPIFSMMYGKFVAQSGGNDPYDTALNDLGRIISISAAGVILTNSAGITFTYTSSGPAR